MMGSNFVPPTNCVRVYFSVLSSVHPEKWILDYNFISLIFEIDNLKFRIFALFSLFRKKKGLHCILHLVFYAWGYPFISTTHKIIID